MRSDVVTDKIIGSVTILVILLLMVYVAFAMWQNERLSQNTVYVLFSEIGSLQNEDDVTIRGFGGNRIVRAFHIQHRHEIQKREPEHFGQQKH